jgi:hypothetical protein
VWLPWRGISAGYLELAVCRQRYRNSQQTHKNKHGRQTAHGGSQKMVWKRDSQQTKTSDQHNYDRYPPTKFFARLRKIDGKS